MTLALAQAAWSPLPVDAVLAPYIYVFWAAYGISFIFTPIMRSVAIYYRIIDEPDMARKMHSRPVAYLGGVAVFLGWISGLALSQLLYLHRSAPGLLDHVVIPFSIVLGACMIVLLGLWDDIRRINPSAKIVVQVLAAIVLLYSDIGTDWSAWLLDPLFDRLHRWFPSWIPLQFTPKVLVYATSSILTVAIVVFCCNAANLMDGLDGLCGGVTAIVALGFVILAVHLGTRGLIAQTNLDAVRLVLGLALLGGVLGFVPYNFNPASIFMGDTGSMFLGFCCAVLILLLADAGSKWFLAAGVMFALPVLDTTLAFARRWVNRRPLFSADKFHFHHQLVTRGLSVRKAVVLSYLLATGFMLMGTAIVFMRTRYAVTAYLMIFGSIIVAAYKMGMVHERSNAILGQSGKSNGQEAGVGEPDQIPADRTEPSVPTR